MPSRRLSHLAALVTAAASLTACATAPEMTPNEQALVDDLQNNSLAPATVEARKAVKREDTLTQAAFWAQEYENSPADRQVALEFARASREIGRPARAAAVANQALAIHPNDKDLLAVLGAALIEDGRAAAAVEPLQRAARLEGDNAHVLVYLGAAFDHDGRHEEARRAYADAMAAGGETPQLLSNIGLSYALDGDAETAEDYLRRAAALPGADARVRQNLALALALQGKFDEAEVIALQDVSAQTATANVNYVRSMISRPRRWESLRSNTYE